MSVIDQGRLIETVRESPRVLVVAPRRSGKTSFCQLWLERREETKKPGLGAQYLALTYRQSQEFSERLGKLNVWCGASSTGLVQRETAVLCLDGALFMREEEIRAAVALQCPVFAISSSHTPENERNRQLFVDAGFVVLDAPLLSH
jgi:hypothetical protein